MNIFRCFEFDDSRKDSALKISCQTRNRPNLPEFFNE